MPLETDKEVTLPLVATVTELLVKAPSLDTWRWKQRTLVRSQPGVISRSVVH